MMTLFRFATCTAVFFMSSKLVIPSAIPERSSNVRGEADIERNDNIFNEIDFTEDFASETIKSSHSNHPTSSNTTIIGRQKRWASTVIGGAKLAYTIGQAVLSGRERLIAVRNVQPWAVDVECRSADDNLGWRRLGENEGFWFKFKANIWGNTHFWCTAKSDGRYRAFAVYNKGAPNWSKMMYNIRNEGIYLADNFDSTWGIFHRGW